MSTSQRTDRQPTRWLRVGIPAVLVLVWIVVGALGVLSASAKPPAEADATSVLQWNLTAASTLATSTANFADGS